VQEVLIRPLIPLDRAVVEGGDAKPTAPEGHEGPQAAYEFEPARRETDTFPTYIGCNLDTSGCGALSTGFLHPRHSVMDVNLKAGMGGTSVEGEALQDYVNKALGNRSIESLERSFAVIATERATNRMTIFNRGNTGLAVRASSSIPNVFWPVIIAGTEYVDGGLTSRVPVPVARRMGAEVVIAVDVSWRGSQDVDSADVAIRPATPRTRSLDFSARLESIAAGEAAARAALPEIRARIAQAERENRQRAVTAALHNR
jgi:NTE family protein